MGDVADRRPLVWVTGAGGLLGHYLVATAPRYAPQWRLLGVTRDLVDLTNAAAVERLWRQTSPQLVIHCAAISKAVACEADPARTHAVNVEATANLAQLAANGRLIFISTDHVFDGTQGAYRETDPVSPLTTYGRSKVEAERRVSAYPQHTVLRTSLTAGLSPTGDRSFVEETLTAWARGGILKLFTDEFRCPLPAAATARAIWEVATQDMPGLYHLAGAERLSRWEIGQLLAAEYPEKHPQCAPGSLRDYAGPPRAPDLSLDSAKLQSTLSFRLPGFRSWLAAHPRDNNDAIWDPLTL
ncbi:MAG: SDR family oxidoreductase [Nitrospiraceae bacterium]